MRALSRQRRREAGFTLLEVIVATAVMATAIIGLFALVNQSMSNAVRVREYDRAAMLARTRMNELLAAERLPLGERLTGDLGGGYDWEARVEPWEAPSNAPVGTSFLARVDLTVGWGKGPERRTIQVESYRRIRNEAGMNLGSASRLRSGR